MAITAGGNDIDRATEIIVLAFASDPVWGVATARPDGSTAHHAALWRPYVEGAMRHSGVYLNEERTAVSVWIPPGCDEMSEAHQSKVLSVVEASLPAASVVAMLELWERFAEAQPRGGEHAYLSFLATHPDNRGAGVGQNLLRENLEMFDRQGVPTYLESTNPGNNHRYERAGFATIGQFESIFNAAPISRMWRPVGGNPNSD
ncbi:MAG: GNAT family N-acetyltransferase [Terrimesophilobacter sp.]